MHQKDEFDAATHMGKGDLQTKYFFIVQNT